MTEGFNRAGHGAGDVDFVNQIRAERSLPQRAAYAAKQAGFGNRQKVLFNHVNPKKPEKIYYIIRPNH